MWIHVENLLCSKGRDFEMHWTLKYFIAQSSLKKNLNFVNLM